MLRSGTVMRHATCHTVTGSWPCTCSRHQGLLFRNRDTATAGAQRYQPIWEMVNKLRDVMGKRDDKYTLGAPIGWTTPSFWISLEEKESRWNVLEAKRPRSWWWLKAKRLKTPNRVSPRGQIPEDEVINDLKADTITRNVKEHVETAADLTDDSTSYTKLKEHVHSHMASVIPHQDL